MIWRFFGEMYHKIDAESYLRVVHDIDLVFLASHFITHSPQACPHNV